MMAKLKVFRTPIGFHDAYVAAPSQKAALQAWGADADLFARGIAEQVDDPTLMKAPLERPGTVIKVSRGEAADHFKMVEPRSRKKNPSRPTGEDAKTERTPARNRHPPPKIKAPPKPARPSRAALERAEAALTSLDADLDKELSEIAAQERLLKDKRQSVRTAHEAKRKKLEAALERTRATYREKVEKWATA